MTLPVWKATGTIHDTAPAWPTHAAGDFGLLVTETATSTISTPSGWSALPGFPVVQGTGNNTVLHAFYRFATSSGESAPAISGSDHSCGVIITYTGVNGSNPIHAVSTHVRLSGTAQQCPGVTTYLNTCLILNLFTWHLDSAGPLSTPTNNAGFDSSSTTERFDGGTTTGNGGGIVIVEGPFSTAGTLGPTTITFSSAAATACAAVALQASDLTFGIKSKIVNKEPMAIQVKQNTAQTVNVWMADSSDGKTGKTGLTLTGNVSLQKYGESSFSTITPTSITEIGSGHYAITLSSTHMNTVGVCSLRVTATGADPADCANIIDVVAYDKTAVTNLGLSALPAVATGSSGAIPTTGTGANQIAVDGAGNAKADVNKWLAGTIPAVNVTGVPIIDNKYVLGTVIPTPGTAGVQPVDSIRWATGLIPTPTVAGVPNVNAKTWNDLTTVALPLIPTTAGRTLDVSPGGEAGLDWANIGSPTTTVGLSGTTIKTATDIATSEAVILTAVSNIGVTSAALNATAASETITTGSGSGGAANTTQADGTYDSISDTAGTLDFYYEFDISATSGAVGVSAQWVGYVVGLVNTVKVYARNWGGSSWEQVGSLVGIAGTSNMTADYELTSAHTSAGLARIRFAATGLTSATVKTDRILLGYTVVPPTVAAIQSGLATASALATVQADTDDIQTRLPAALTAGGKIKASTDEWNATAVATPTTAGVPRVDVKAMEANTVTAAAAAADLTTELQAGLATSTALGTAQTAITDLQSRVPAALVSGRMDSSVGAMAANVLTAAATAADFGVEIAAAVWAFAHETSRTAKGVLVRLDAWMTGRATGLVGTTATFYRKDDSTKAIEADQNTTLGTRTQASTVAGD